VAERTQGLTKMLTQMRVHGSFSQGGSESASKWANTQVLQQVAPTPPQHPSNVVQVIQ